MGGQSSFKTRPQMAAIAAADSCSARGEHARSGPLFWSPTLANPARFSREKRVRKRNDAPDDLASPEVPMLRANREPFRPHSFIDGECQGCGLV